MSSTACGISAASSAAAETRDSTKQRSRALAGMAAVVLGLSFLGERVISFVGHTHAGSQALAAGRTHVDAAQSDLLLLAQRIEARARNYRSDWGWRSLRDLVPCFVHDATKTLDRLRVLAPEASPSPGPPASSALPKNHPAGP